MALAPVEGMTPAELDGALAWAAAEGWNPGRHDAPAFWAADPDGFFVLKVDGRVVSTLAAVRYDDGFGFLGLYITAPHLRRKGHGLELWCAGRAHLDGCVAGLDAVLEQEPTYARDGFATAYATTRYCVAEPSTLPAPPPLTTVAATDA